jgi:pimeloyl-ACP methyl ester carboxylesterase
MRRGPAAVLLSFVLAGTAGVATTTAEADAGSEQPRVAAQVDITPPTIEWGQCPYNDAPAECATVPLPLDYDDPTGPTTEIGVLRVPARGEKIGTLFVNPGGPGGSATDFAPYAGRLIGPGVQRRFDVVGIDPRGVNLSGNAWCRAEVDETAFFGYPVTEAETRARLRGDRALNEGCAERRSEIVDHASTADVARDMDVIRQALGEEQLTYYGISYGSLLGQTYAAMFPDRVRALIIDGVLNPIEWTVGNDPSLPMTYRLRSGRGAYEALTSALVECDRVGRARCQIAGHANETWLRVVRKARAGELRVGGWRIDLQEVVGQALGSLYSSSSIRYLTDFLAEVDPRRAPSRAGSDAAEQAWAQLRRIRAARDEIGPYQWGDVTRQVQHRDAQRPRRFYLSFESVICGDAVNPTTPRSWVDASALADHRQPWFGRSWTWASSVCAQWSGLSGDDAFRGPWATTTSYPLLVVGNAHDPATPISGARAANRLFADSVLLMMNGWGHGALGDSKCISGYMANYLIERTMPRPGTVCRPDHGPYSG